MKILFVCSSNVCRSPYAEFVFRRLVKSSPVLSAAGVEVSSSAVFNRSKALFPKAAVAPGVLGDHDPDAVLAHRGHVHLPGEGALHADDVLVWEAQLQTPVQGVPHGQHPGEAALREARAGEMVQLLAAGGEQDISFLGV